MILTILRILYLRLRNNPLELLLVFVMPVIFFSIFAAIFSNGIATGSDKKLRVGWIADRSTALGSELKDFLETSSTLQCLPLLQETTSTRSPISPTSESSADHDGAFTDSLIADAQRSGRYDLIIRLPNDFPNELSDSKTTTACSVALVTDGQNPMAVAMVTSVVNGFFAQKSATLIAQQLTRLSSSRALSRSATVVAQDDLLVGQQIEAIFSGSPPQQQKSIYFDSVQEPSQIVMRGVRFSDPTKSQSWFFGEKTDNSLLFGNSPALISSQSPSQQASRPMSGATKKKTLAEMKSDPQSGKLVRTALVKSSAPEIPSTVNITVENPQSTNQANPRIAMYAAGIAVLFLLFSSTGNAAALLEESESGTLDRILISKAGLFQIMGGKWLGIFLLGCIQISVMFLWAELIFKIQLWKHLDGFAVMTLCTSAATSSFAMLLATLCSSRAQLNAVSVVLILSMSAVGGSMIPRFAMSDRMKEIGQWTFNAWALDGYQKVFWFQSPISSLQTEVAVLLGSAGVFGLIALILSLRWKFS